MNTPHTYASYKTVQHNYINQLPTDWQLLPNIAIFEERKEKGTLDKELLSISSYKGIIKTSDYEDKKDRSSIDKSEYLLVKENDLAYNTMLMWDGAVGYSQFEGIVSPAYTVLKPKVILNTLFFHYLFRTEFYKNYVKQYSYGIVDSRLRLYYTYFKRLQSPVPPITTQNQIANYLNHQNQLIDNFIKNKQQLIQLLEERKNREIHLLVTGKHLTNCLFKTSNLDTIGDVPDNWRIQNLNIIAEVVLGKMLCNDDKGDSYLKPYLKSKNIGWERVIVEEVDSMWFSKTELTLYRIKKNDLLVSEGGEVGKTCIWNDELEECYIQNSVHKLSLKHGYNPHYYLYYLYSLGKASYFKSIVNQVSIAHLTKEKLTKIKCLVPPLEEQTAIVAQINQTISNHQQIVQQITHEITLIKEYRSSLITALVTGQRAVPVSFTSSNH